MNRILIDTNIYSYALKGDKKIIFNLQKANEIGISSISVGELLSGFKGGNREAQNREELEEFLDSPRVSVYPVDESTADFYADILDGLRKIGKPIPTNDIWIAAVSFQYGFKLYSKDEHFKNVAGLSLIDAALL
ncbi:MAG: type II toxin-antitoxin system VapC family toxin [Spirochaetia bacterium]|nr:type II toxin-antitoxin system VapC family toxin [Spirochaetia bacterium]